MRPKLPTRPERKQIEQNLKLTPAQLEAGRIALARYEAKVRVEAVADALGLDMDFEPKEVR
jgi:hypothetical protein